jgi:1-acyl-sn-glycerol-3-phosphate acyltransferase
MSPPNRTTVPRRTDPIALRSPARVRFFEGVMTRQVRGAFRAVRLARPGVPHVPPDRPLLICAAHPSWWDPALFLAVMPRLFPGRAGYGPIDAEMLQRYGFMRRIGLFGVRSDDRRAGADFLGPAMRIAADPRSVLWISAQGTFADPRLRPVRLRGGSAHLMARVPGIVALPLAVEYPFWGEKRPEALLAFGDPLNARPGEAAADIGTRLAAGLESAMDGLATLAIDRDASAFERIIDGARGIGGTWGGWGRLRAALSGRRYQADHMAEEMENT